MKVSLLILFFLYQFLCEAQPSVSQTNQMVLNLQIAFDVNDWVTVIKYSDTLISLNETDESFIFYFDRAYANFKIGNNENAIEDYKIALQIDSNSKETNLNIGIAYNTMNEWGLAIPYFDRATKINGLNSDSYVGRGN